MKSVSDVFADEYINLSEKIKKNLLGIVLFDFFPYLCARDWASDPFPDMKYKKRYAYLVDENLRNFQMSKDGIVVLTFCVSCYITTSARWVFSGPSSKTWLHGSSRFLH